MRYLAIRPLSENRLDGIEIHCDHATAQLIADALDCINPDDPAEAAFAEAFAFNIASSIKRWSPPLTQGD